MSAAVSPSGRGMTWFGAACGSWYGAFGMQSLLFAWLVVGELRAPPQWVGIAQTASSLPQLALLMLGGAAADRLEPRRMLATMHLAAALPALALALVVFSGNLDLASVIGYGITLGAINAFLMPARDTLLSRVAGADMIRSVTAMTVIQFAAQIVGTLIGGTTEHVGASTVLAAQALVLSSGAAFALRLPGPEAARMPTAAAVLARRRGSWHQATAGFREVWINPALFSILLLVASVGLFFIGPFLVIFPVLVRDFYQGGAQDLSVVLMLFPLGTIAGSLALRARSNVERRVRATMLALLAGSALLAAIAAGPGWWLLLTMTFFWGLCGAVFINLSRAVFQEQATDENRARVLSIYQLGLMGGSPVGSLLSGFASASVGPHMALFVAAAAMTLVVLALWIGSDSAAME